MKKGFDNEKYLATQSRCIRERIDKFGDKLYLEFGGKLFDDYHASRVLPGFEPDSKLQLLMQLSEHAEIVIVISAVDIEKNKIRGDLGITYDTDVLRLIDSFEERGLFVGSVVITKYSGQTSADLFKQRLIKLGIKVYTLYMIPGYPNNVSHIVSDEGFGKNDYIETSRPLVVITAPGPGSGKMATCLSQLYRNCISVPEVSEIMDKFGTFRVSLRLNFHALIPLGVCVNVMDLFHLEAYGFTTVNYNRDVEIFRFESSVQRSGRSPYQSPTDMGVNMAGNCICDDALCQEASRQEIIRRYFNALNGLLTGRNQEEEVYKIELIMNQAGVTATDRKVVPAARRVAELTGAPAAAIELPDGRIITGKTSDLLGAASAVLLNALKELAGIDHEKNIIAPESLEPIQRENAAYLGSRNPRLHTDEVLIALSISAAAHEDAALAMKQLPKLAECQAHTSVMLSPVDIKKLKQLGIQFTMEAKYENNKNYH